MKFGKTLVALFAVVVLIMAIPLTASAASTETKSIELETYSALLIDKSGSANKIAAVETVVGQYDFASYDVVVPFDHRISTDSNFAGGGNSHICEVIDQLIDGGFTHITVITDGEQWPEDYSALGVYTNVDLTIHLVEEDEESSQFINQLKSRLVNSDLKVTKPDGTEEMLLNGYKKPIYSIEVPVVEDEPSEGEDNSSENVEDEDNVFIENTKEGYFPWWLVLILAAIIAALFDFIHELITRGRNKEEEDDDTDTTTTTGTSTPVVPKPMPAKAVVHIAQGAHVVADFSGSMAAQQSETAKACMDAQKGSEAVICFGDSVSEHTADELEGIQAAGQTAGWEAMEQAAAKGWDEVVLVSDLGFNGKTFDESAFSKKFKKITVVTPSNYHVPTLENLKKIADEVEVLSL